MILSKAAQESSEVAFSKWVAPDVGTERAANELVSEASLAGLRESAHSEGYAAGLAAGKEAGRASIDAKIALLDGLLTHLQEPLGKLEPQALQAMIELSVLVSESLINRELSLDPALVNSAVTEAIRVLPETGNGLRVRVNPDDLEVVREAFADTGREAAAVFCGEPAIQRGGAVVESGASLVDAQMKTRLTAMLDSLLCPVAEAAPEKSE